jgi:hypothetical protein
MDFLEGCWRSDVEGMQTKERVGNIALFGMDNDTRNYETLMQLSASESWAVPMNGIIRRLHYRMTLKLVGQNLTRFESSHEFISAIADAMEGKNFQLHADRILNVLQQPTITPTSMPRFFIMTLVSAIFSSRIIRRAC